MSHACMHIACIHVAMRVLHSSAFIYDVTQVRAYLPMAIVLSRLAPLRMPLIHSIQEYLNNNNNFLGFQKKIIWAGDQEQVILLEWPKLPQASSCGLFCCREDLVSA